jgi:hypothetical protein
MLSEIFSRCARNSLVRPYRSRRDANHGSVGRNVSGHDSPGPDHTPGPNPSLGHHRGPNTNQGALLNFYIAAQVYARPKVDVVAKPIVMINGAGCIQNYALADVGAGIDHHASADHCPRSYFHLRANDSGGMDGGGKLLVLTMEGAENFLAGMIMANGHNDRIVSNRRQLGHSPQNRQLEECLLVQGRVVIEKAGRFGL